MEKRAEPYSAKDRFRQGLGEVVESYEIVGRRLGINF
jgi:phosphoribosylaminoimidazole-succinocarboxamide synthase